MRNGSQRLFNAGMTLLEVMVALMLLGVGVMAVAAMLDISQRSNARAQDSVADTIAASKMVERILALPYDDPRLEDVDDAFNPQDPDHGPVVVGRRSSTVEWEVDRNFPVPHTKRVLVTVRSFGGPGAARQTRFDYLKTRDLTLLSAGAARP